MKRIHVCSDCFGDYMIYCQQYVRLRHSEENNIRSVLNLHSLKTFMDEHSIGLGHERRQPYGLISWATEFFNKFITTHIKASRQSWPNMICSIVTRLVFVVLVSREGWLLPHQWISKILSAGECWSDNNTTPAKKTVKQSFNPIIR